MPVHLQIEVDDPEVEALRPAVQRAAEATLAAERAAHLEVSVTVVDAPTIHRLHRDYLDRDEPTDVISFPLREEGDPDPLLGEVVASADRAREEAEARGIPLSEELCRYVVHGCLHLLGYDDRAEADREAMHARQEALLASLAPGGQAP